MRKKKVEKLMRWDEIINRMPKDRRIIGVEVGVYRGKLASEVLRKLPLLTLYMVDMWRPYYAYYDDMKYADDGSAINKKFCTDAAFEAIHQECLQRISPFQDRTIILREESIVASQILRGQGLKADYIFVDANHSYQHAKNDIEAWLPLLRAGGYICGHDFQPRFPGVQKAVEEIFGIGVVTCGHDSTWFLKVS